MFTRKRKSKDKSIVKTIEKTQGNEEPSQENLIPTQNSAEHVHEPSFNEKIKNLLSGKKTPEKEVVELVQVKNPSERKKNADDVDVTQSSKEQLFSPNVVDVVAEIAAEEKAPPLDWYTVAVSICIFATMSNYYQLHGLGHEARKCGGLYFVIAYIVFESIAGYAVTAHFIHISAFTQKGLSSIFGTHVKGLRCLGFALVAVIIVNKVWSVHLTADMLSYVSRTWTDSKKLLHCDPNDTKYNCANHTNTFEMRDCCSSLWKSFECRTKNKTLEFSLGDRCMTHYPANVYLQLPAEIYVRSYRESLQLQGFDVAHFVAALSILVVVTAFALSGVRIFTFAVAGIAVFSVLLLIGYMIAMWVLGDMTYGFRQLIRLSQPEKVFTLEFFGICMYFVFASAGVRLQVLSVGSYRPQKMDFFKFSLLLHFGQLLWQLLLFIADMSLVGYFDSVGHRTSYHGESSKLFYEKIMPEFFGTLGGGQVSLWYHVYVGIGVLMEFGNIASMFFVCFTILRDHFPKATVLFEKSFCSVWSTIVLGLTLVIQYLGQKAHILKVTSDLWSCLFTAFGLIATISIYGHLQVLLDISSTHKPKSALAYALGPVAPYRSVLLAKVIAPIFLICSVFTLPYFPRSFSASPSIGQIACQFILFSIPLLVFLGFFVYDIRQMLLSEQSAWRMMYPTTDHPSYSRILPEDLNFTSLPPPPVVTPPTETKEK